MTQTTTLLDTVARSGGFGVQPQQAFLRPLWGAKIASVYTLALLAVSAYPNITHCEVKQLDISPILYIIKYIQYELWCECANCYIQYIRCTYV